MTINTTRVLFVDDESMVLDGVRRVLRQKRPAWRPVFASSGVQAVGELAAAEFDVVVTDVRMPRMGGLELLDRVRQAQPRAVRMVFSGRTDTAEIASRMGLVHQLLSKPCDVEMLIATIERTTGLVQLLSADRLREVAARTDSLPAWPERLLELSAELDREDTSAAQVATIIGRDPGMTTKVLHMANSSFFGSARRIRTVQDAVTRMGLKTVRSVLVSAHAFDSMQAKGPIAPVREALWSFSMGAAKVARKVGTALALPAAAIESGQLAAMLSQVGRLLLVSTFGESYLAVASARPPRTPLSRAERDHYGATSADLGAYLLGLWGFDDQVVSAVAKQECPADAARQDDPVLLLVHLARCLAQPPAGASPVIDRIDPDGAFLLRHGVGEDHEVLQGLRPRHAA